MQTIVKNVQFPHARRWLEGLLGLLIANNRSFCPRVAKMHDYSRHNATSPKCLAVQRGPKRTIIRGLRLRGGASECSRGQSQRLFADAFDLARTWGAPVLSKRWLARCQEDRGGVCFCRARRQEDCADVCFCRACCGVACAFLLASFQVALLRRCVCLRG